MAFYKDFENRTRQEKRERAINRGGFEDEGSRYRGQKNPTRKSYGDKPRYDDRRGDKPRFDDRRPYGDRPRFDDRKPYGKKPYGDKPRFEERRPYGDKPRFDDRKPRFEERRPQPPKKDRGYESFRYDAPAPAPLRREPPRPVEEEIIPAENLLAGRNPIREALKSGRDIEKLMVARGELSGSAREIVQLAREQHIPVQEVDRARLDAITRNHQGMLAFASAYQYATVEEMLSKAEEKGEAPFLVLLDGITDPHNLGAIIRSAECAGAHGVIVQERRAVGLTPAAVKASAGAVEYLPVARVTNLTATIEKLQALNIWVYAADMDGEDYAGTDFSGGVALVIGAEGEGVSRRVLDTCDKTVSLPIRGHVDSLNASVAAGILMYAVMRSR